MNPQNLNWPPQNTADAQNRVKEILEKQKEKERLENDIADLNKRDEQVELNIKLGNPNAEEEKSHLINEVAKLNHQIGEIKTQFPDLDKEYEAIKKAEAEEAERIKQEEITKQQELAKAEADKEEKTKQEAIAKEEAEKAEKERLEKEEIAKAEAEQKAIDEAKAKEEAEKIRKEEIEKNFLENEKKVDETRNAYVEEFLKYKKEAKKQNLINKTREVISNSFKNAEEKSEIKSEKEKIQKEAKDKLDKSEREYLQSRKKLAESMASKKEDELRESGLSENEIKAELVEYKATEILKKTIHEEKQKVINAKVEKSPINKAVWKKLVDGYMGLPKGKRILLGTFLALPIAATTGVGASIVASYGLVGLGGLFTGKALLSMGTGTVSGFLAKRIERVKYFKKKDDYFKDKKEEYAQDYGNRKITLERYERELEQLEKQEKKMNRNKRLLRITVGVSVGAAVGGFTYHELINGISAGNVAESATSIGGGHTGTLPGVDTTHGPVKLPGGGIKINVEEAGTTQPPAGTGAVETAHNNTEIKITADNGNGAIKNLEELQGKLKAEYGADLSKAPESVKHIINTDATKLAQEYGQYDPTKVDESAMIMKGDTYTFDEKNGLVFHHDGSATTLEAGKAYTGKMFDSNHTEVKAPSDLENHEVAHTEEINNPENTTPEIDPEDPTPEDLAKLAQMENLKANSVPTEELLKTPEVKVGTDHTLTGKEMEDFLADKPKVNVNNTNINDLNNFRKDIPLTTAKEPVLNYPGSNYAGDVRVATGVISPTHGIYDNGSGIVYQPSLDNAVASNTLNNSWTTPVPMTNRAVFENAIMHPVRAEIPVEGVNSGFDIDHNPNHFRTGHEVQEAFGKKNVIIDQPDHKTINGIKNENWNTATDEMFKSKGKVFNSPDEYEKEDTMQRLVGHGEQKVEYVPTIDKNAQVIKMDYFRDTQEWDTVKKIPAKYFFDFKEVRADGSPLLQEDIDKLLKAGIIKQSSGGYEFTNKGELERISNVYKEYTPKAERGLHNDMPIGDENLESYIGRMTRVVHTTDNGTLYAVENHGQTTPVVVKTANGITNNNIENAPAGTPKSNIPTSNNSTNTVTATNTNISRIFPANEQVQGVSRADFDREVERQLSESGKTWSTQADKEADLWIWEKFAKITDTLPADQSVDNKVHLAFQSPDANEFIKEDVYARDLMRIDNNIVGKELLDLREKVVAQTGALINPDQGELTSAYVRRLMSKLTNGK